MGLHHDVGLLVLMRFSYSELSGLYLALLNF